MAIAERLIDLKPAVVTDVEMAFPANALELMPPEEDIPDEYSDRDRWEARLWSALFFKGVTDLSFVPVEGIDPELAWRHLRCILGSFAPRHQHKEAALAYLTALWFRGASWTVDGERHAGGEAPGAQEAPE